MARALVLLAMASCLAILLVGPAGATYSCAPKKCPSGYEVTNVPNINTATETLVSCAYTCTRPANLNCFPKYARSTNPSLYDYAVSLTKPYVCGGTDYKGDPGRPCPGVACGAVSTYSVSGSGGCSFAKASLDVLSISAADFNMTSDFQAILMEYCVDGNSDEDSLVAYAKAAATATAKQVVKTLIHYNVYMCQCACGTLSANYAVIKADVQSVATAIAKSWVQAQAGVANNATGAGENCYGNILQFASMYADAIAVAVETAVDKVNLKFVNKVAGYETCTTTGVQTQVQTAVAEALVCVYAEAFAAAANNKPIEESGVQGLAYSCGTAIAVSGSFVSEFGKKVCPIKWGCDCSPAAQGYNNTGFETGKFSGKGYNGYPVYPQWSIYSQQGDAYEPSIVSVETDSGCTNQETFKILPSEGEKFAKIDGTQYVCPEGVASIKTKIEVPPCANIIAIDYIFKCKDYRYDGQYAINDKATITIVATNVLDPSIVKTKTVDISCKDVGTCGFSNRGKWATLSVYLGADKGLYNVEVKAKEINNANVFASDLYVDNLRYVYNPYLE